MSIVFFGTPEFAVPSLEALVLSGETVAFVVTQPDKARGRGRKRLPSPVKECALRHGIKTLTPRSMKDEAFLAEIEAIKPEFIVAVAYGRILTGRILDLPTVAPVNVHASLLPRYRGASPITAALMNGDKDTGVTTMLMARGLDTGDVLLQETMPIEPEDTTGTLSVKLSEAGGPLLVRTLKGMRDGSVRPTPQGEPSTGYARMLTKEDGYIDWSKSAGEIHNMIRALSPWPSAYTFSGKKRLKIIRSEAIEGARQAGAEPGTVTDVTKGYFDVATKEGTIRVHELQPEGKRAMEAREFLAGRSLEKGTILQ